MYTKTAILFTAGFMLLTASTGFAQDTTSEEEVIKPYPVCSTWKSKHGVTKACKIAFMRAASPLGQKCKGITIPEAGQGHIDVYMTACHCESECKQ